MSQCFVCAFRWQLLQFRVFVVELSHSCKLNCLMTCAIYEQKITNLLA